MKKSTPFAHLLCLLFFCTGLAAVSPAEETAALSAGQLIYVPAYSHIYRGNYESPFPLTVILSIRNIDPANALRIVLVDYYETQGKHLKKFIEKPVTLGPLGSVRYIIAEKDNTGGSGANFMVEWKTEKPINPPIVESIMIGTKSQQGISFTSRGRAISQH